MMGILIKPKICEDGKLWIHRYQGIPSKEAWKFCNDFDGLITFYRVHKQNDESDTEWIEHTALFMDGKMIKFDGKIL